MGRRKSCRVMMGGKTHPVLCVCFCGRVFGLGRRILCRWRYSPFITAAAVVWGVPICSWLARGMCASFSSRGRQRANMELKRLRGKSSPVHGGRGGHGGGYWCFFVWISKNFVLAVCEVFSRKEGIPVRAAPWRFGKPRVSALSCLRSPPTVSGHRLPNLVRLLWTAVIHTHMEAMFHQQEYL
jgi:hypothetical protein